MQGEYVVGRQAKLVCQFDPFFFSQLEPSLFINFLYSCLNHKAENLPFCPTKRRTWVEPEVLPEPGENGDGDSDRRGEACLRRSADVAAGAGLVVGRPAPTSSAIAVAILPMAQWASSLRWAMAVVVALCSVGVN